MVKIVTDLDTGFEGWTSGGDGSKFAWSSTYGLGSGGIRYRETTSNWADDTDYLFAPAEFLGVISNYSFFKFSTYISEFDSPSGFWVEVTGSNGVSLKQFYTPSQATVWEMHSIDLTDPNAWVDNATGIAPDAATLNATMSDLTVFTLNLDGLAGSVNNIVYLDNPQLVCFTRGTLILTDRGEVPIEEISTNDMVWTLGDAFRPVRWISSRIVPKRLLEQNEKLRPIIFGAGSLGHGLPVSELSVSPQHRMLLRSKTVEHAFGVDEVLIAANRLLTLPNVRRATPAEPVEYFHILFDHHEIIKANGALSESMHTGAETRKAIPPAQWNELITLFPDLAEQSIARQVKCGKSVEHLLHRLQKNGRDLYVT